MRTKSIVIPESQVLKSCMMRAKAMHVPCFRRNVMAMSARYNGKDRHVSSGKPGQSDLWGWFPDKYCQLSGHWCEARAPGRHWECEVKRAGEKPTLKQAVWLRDCNEHTGSAFWVDNADTFEAVLMALLSGYRIEYHEEYHKYGKLVGPTFHYDFLRDI